MSWVDGLRIFCSFKRVIEKTFKLQFFAVQADLSILQDFLTGCHVDEFRKPMELKKGLIIKLAFGVEKSKFPSIPIHGLDHPMWF